jgi:hypothetical protein
MSLKENDRQRKKENWLETEVIIAGFRVQGRKEQSSSARFMT